MVARADLQRRLVEEVLALDEPYRSTLVERWFEGRTPEQIARRLGISDSTVRTRLAREHALLRERLQRREGTTWMSALAALGAAHGSAPAATTTLATGGTLVAAGTKLTLIAVAVALGALWWAWPAHDATQASGAPEARAASAPAPAGDVTPNRQVSEAARERVVVPRQETPTPAVASPPPELSEVEAEELEARDRVFEGLKLRGLVIRGREPLESGTAWLAQGNRIAPRDQRKPWGGVLNPVPTPDGEPCSTPTGSGGRFEFEFRSSAWSSGSSSRPFRCDRRQARRAHARAIDVPEVPVDLPLAVEADAQRLHDPVDGAVAAPEAEAVVDAMPRPEALRDDPPRRACPEDSEHAAECGAVVIPTAAARLAREQGAGEGPILVAELVSSHPCASLGSSAAQDPASARCVRASNRQSHEAISHAWSPSIELPRRASPPAPTPAARPGPSSCAASSPSTSSPAL